MKKLTLNEVRWEKTDESHKMIPEIIASKKELEKLFGESTDQDIDFKILDKWIFEFDEEDYFSLYDWKFLEIYEREPRYDEFRRWYIGGKNEEKAILFKNEIEKLLKELRG